MTLANLRGFFLLSISLMLNQFLLLFNDLLNASLTRLSNNVKRMVVVSYRPCGLSSVPRLFAIVYLALMLISRWAPLNASTTILLKLALLF